jgi:hypothetical protein
MGRAAVESFLYAARRRCQHIHTVWSSTWPVQPKQMRNLRIRIEITSAPTSGQSKSMPLARFGPHCLVECPLRAKGLNRRGTPAQPHSWHVPAGSKAYGEAWLDRSTGPRPDSRRLQRASSRVCPQGSECLSVVPNQIVSVAASKPELVTKAPTALLCRRLLHQSCRKLRLRQTPRLNFPHQFQRWLSQATA